MKICKSLNKTWRIGTWLMFGFFTLLPCRGQMRKTNGVLDQKIDEAVIHYEKDDIPNTYISKAFAELDQQGDPRGTMWMARLYLAGRLAITASPFRAQAMAKEVMPQINRLVEQGDKHAQFLLGSCYQEGLGVEPNVGLAKMWLTKAAEAGHMTALNNLANMVLHAQGCDPDLKKAEELFSRAAGLGSIMAVNNLAIIRSGRNDVPMLQALRKAVVVQVVGMTESKGIEFLTKRRLIADPDDFILTRTLTTHQKHFKADGLYLVMANNNRILQIQGHAAGSLLSNEYQGEMPLGLSWETPQEQFRIRFGNPQKEMDFPHGDFDALYYELNNLGFEGHFERLGEKKLSSWIVNERWAVKTSEAIALEASRQ